MDSWIVSIKPDPQQNLKGNMNHSPIPWSLKINQDSGYDTPTLLILDNDGSELMDSTPYYQVVPDKLDDWEFICRSVNSYYHFQGLIQHYQEVIRDLISVIPNKKETNK